MARRKSSTRVWREAADLGYDRYFIPQTMNFRITDDHVPLLKAGLRVIDVIDYNYPAHHTPQDAIGQISAESLTDRRRRGDGARPVTGRWPGVASRVCLASCL